MSAPLLEARHLVKNFPGVRALKGVSLALGRGEILAVIGENGAGKSTLMKILAGGQTPDRGEVIIDGHVRSLDSVPAAMALGIALIHQELNLAETLEVGANIFLGREPNRWGVIDSAKISTESRRFLEQVGLKVDPATPLANLSIGQRQLVEIAKALSLKARVLIMDEPTSSLAAHESQALLRLIRDLRHQGVSILYISHRLSEVAALADRVVVLRDGENAGTLTGDQITHASMVRLMVGRDLAEFYPHKRQPRGPVALEVTALRTAAHPHHAVTFRLHAGEQVALAGLVGAGRTELLETIFGLVPAISGQMQVGGDAFLPTTPTQAIAAGLALVPEDRKNHGLLLAMSVAENLGLGRLVLQKFPGLLKSSEEKTLCDEMVTTLRIKTPSSHQPVQFLSGGNQQKVVLGKWLALRPRVLLLDEPTRGVDIGAKQEIYRLMDELTSQGVAILFASSELPEILGMADRVLVMHEGQITGELDRAHLSEPAIMALATNTPAPAPTSPGSFS